MQITKILLLRGSLANMPLLSRGEAYFALDEHRLYVGDGLTNWAIGQARINEGDKGDITVSALGATWIVNDGAITPAKMADIATDTIIGRTAAAAGPPSALTPTEVLDMIGGATGNILAREAADWQALAPGSKGNLLQIADVGGNLVPRWQQPGKIILAEIQASGTQGGGAVAGAWTTRTLNTVVSDTLGGAVTLSANLASGPVGRYRFRARVPAFNVNSHQCRLVRGTGTVYAYGSSECTQVGATSWSECVWEGDFDPALMTVKIEHQVQTTVALFGLGVGCGFGNNEVYSTLEIERIWQ